eukprot:14882-Pelagococcus_subviridis.AAC.2
MEESAGWSRYCVRRSVGTCPADARREKSPTASGFRVASSSAPPPPPPPPRSESSVGGSCFGSPTATNALHPNRDIAMRLDGSVICEHSSKTHTEKVMPFMTEFPHDAVVTPTTRHFLRNPARRSATPSFAAWSSFDKNALSLAVVASLIIARSSARCAAPFPLEFPPSSSPPPPRSDAHELREPARNKRRQDAVDRDVRVRGDEYPRGRFRRAQTLRGADDERRQRVRFSAPERSVNQTHGGHRQRVARDAPTRLGGDEERARDRAGLIVVQTVSRFQTGRVREDRVLRRRVVYEFRAEHVRPQRERLRRRDRYVLVLRDRCRRVERADRVHGLLIPHPVPGFIPQQLDLHLAGVIWSVPRRLRDDGPRRSVPDPHVAFGVSFTSFGRVVQGEPRLALRRRFRFVVVVVVVVVAVFVLSPVFLPSSTPVLERFVRVEPQRAVRVVLHVRPGTPELVRDRFRGDARARGAARARGIAAAAPSRRRVETLPRRRQPRPEVVSYRPAKVRLIRGRRRKRAVRDRRRARARATRSIAAREVELQREAVFWFDPARSQRDVRDADARRVRPRALRRGVKRAQRRRWRRHRLRVVLPVAAGAPSPHHRDVRARVVDVARARVAPVAPRRARRRRRRRRLRLDPRGQAAETAAAALDQRRESTETVGAAGSAAGAGTGGGGWLGRVDHDGVVPRRLRRRRRRRRRRRGGVRMVVRRPLALSLRERDDVHHWRGGVFIRRRCSPLRRPARVLRILFEVLRVEIVETAASAAGDASGQQLRYQRRELRFDPRGFLRVDELPPRRPGRVRLLRLARALGRRRRRRRLRRRARRRLERRHRRRPERRARGGLSRGRVPRAAAAPRSLRRGRRLQRRRGRGRAGGGAAVAASASASVVAADFVVRLDFEPFEIRDDVAVLERGHLLLRERPSP